MVCTDSGKLVKGILLLNTWACHGVEIRVTPEVDRIGGEQFVFQFGECIGGGRGVVEVVVVELFLHETMKINVRTIIESIAITFRLMLATLQAFS